MSTSKPDHPWKAPPPNTSTLGVRASIYQFGRTHSVYNTPKLSQWPVTLRDTGTLVSSGWTPICVTRSGHLAPCDPTMSLTSSPSLSLIPPLSASAAPPAWGPLLPSVYVHLYTGNSLSFHSRLTSQLNFLFQWVSSSHQVDTSLSQLQEIVKDREAQCSAVLRVAKSQTRLSNWTTTTNFLWPHVLTLSHPLPCFLPARVPSWPSTRWVKKEWTEAEVILWGAKWVPESGPGPPRENHSPRTTGSSLTNVEQDFKREEEGKGKELSWRPGLPSCPFRSLWNITQLLKKNEIMLFAATWTGLDIEWSKSDREEELSYDIPYRQNLKRSDTNELIYKTETDPQT